MKGWWRSYAVCATLAMLIATAAFVHYRNTSFQAHETERARIAAKAASGGEPASPAVVASGRILPAERSVKYPFLSSRKTADGKELGGPDAASTDKLLYDAAGRAERDGAFSEFMRDGSGRVVAALPLPRGGAAVAITEPPEGPQGFPWLIIFGLISIGALVTAASASAGREARALGLGLAASGLSVPAFMWAGWVPAAAITLLATGFGIAEYRGWLARAGDEIRRERVAYAFLGPAAISMVVLVATPFVIGLVLGFYNHHHGEWTFVGIDNFVEILSGDGRSFDDPLNFWFTLGVTVLWTAINVALHVSIGVGLALLLRQRWLAGRGIYRMLLILPWAIPNYITALIWHGMFQGEYGAVNGILGIFGINDVSWFSEWASAFTANVVTNTWLGFPFMMVVALGALESIPRDMYEAAEVDGASGWQRFKHITLPHLGPALAPAVVLGAIWTFNMFNVIYLVSDGRPGGSTDILVTEAYRWAFERGERYGLASAYATLIFGILLLWTVFGTRVTRKNGKNGKNHKNGKNGKKQEEQAS